MFNDLQHSYCKIYNSIECNYKYTNLGVIKQLLNVCFGVEKIHQFKILKNLPSFVKLAMSPKIFYLQKQGDL